MVTVHVNNSVNCEFASENMSQNGLETFLSRHSSSKFCKLLSFEKNLSYVLTDFRKVFNFRKDWNFIFLLLIKILNFKCIT